jgi:hypothetical protein
MGACLSQERKATMLEKRSPLLEIGHHRVVVRSKEMGFTRYQNCETSVSVIAAEANLSVDASSKL